MTPDPLFQAILEDPDDDSLRLVHADWLDEHGQPRRAEFIRVQCQLAAMLPADPRRLELEAIEQWLLREHDLDWVGPLALCVDGWEFRRGFVDKVRLSAQQFLAYAESIFRLAPVRGLTLQGAEPVIQQLADCPWLARVRSLDFTCENLRDEGVRALAASPYLGRLTDLCLARSGVGDEGVLALADTPHLPRLTKLDLRANGVGGGGAQALLDSPHLRELAWLDLSMNFFTGLDGWGGDYAHGITPLQVEALQQRFGKVESDWLTYP